MENNAREQRLKVILKLLFISIILVVASEVIYCYIYKFLSRMNPLVINNPVFRMIGDFLTPRIVNQTVINLSFSVLSAAICVFGLININKKKAVNGCLFLLGGIFLVKAFVPFYPLILGMISHIPTTYFKRIWFEFSFLIIRPLFVLVPVILCLIANMKKSDHQKAKKESDKAGFGGFFIVAMIRNVSLPINNLIVVIMLVLGNFTSHGRIDMETLINNRMLLIAVFGLIISVMAAVRMFTKRFAFIPTIISAEGVLIYYYANKILMACTLARQYYMRLGYFESGIASDILMIIVSMLFIVYYSRSKRVENTFTRL